MKLLNLQSSASSCHCLLGPNVLLSNLFSNTLTLCFLLSVKDQVLHPYKTTGNISSVYILIFKFLTRDD